MPAACCGGRRAPSLGDGAALAGVLVVSLILLAAAVAMVAPRFGDYAIAAASVDQSPAGRRAAISQFSRHLAAPRAPPQGMDAAAPRSVAGVANADADALSACRRRFCCGEALPTAAARYNLLVPVLVMAAGQLAGGLAWLSISGEDAPDLVATAPVPARFILRAKIEAVLAVIAAMFAPLVVVLAVVSLWHALVDRSAASSSPQRRRPRSSSGSATQAKRSQFRRRQVSSRIATFAEAFSSIGWAATAAVAAVSIPLAVAPAVMALIVLGGARYLSPRQ